MEKRHCNWLRRSSKDMKPAYWLPHCVFRIYATRFCRHFDTQLRVSCGKPAGMSFFQKPESPVKMTGERQHWPSWPHVAQVLDVGADQTCGCHVQERLFKINSDLWNDPWHCTSRDVFLAGTYTWGLSIVMCVLGPLQPAIRATEERRVSASTEVPLLIIMLS